jgi:2-methylcitrate dehydratase PrpD
VRSKAILEFIHETQLADFPERVRRKGARCFADLLACSLAGIPSRVGKIVRSFVLSLGGCPEVSVWGDGRKAPLSLAVLANATICEALDADDGFNPMKGHPGAFLFPTAMAFAERDGVRGPDILSALLVGYEIAMRGGLAVRRVCETYHGSGSWGGIGAAAIAARLLGLTAGQTGHALDAAEYHGTMAPIMRCVGLPGMVKDGVAWGTFSGVIAAQLAREGFTSTPSVLDLPEADDLVASLGSEYLIEQLYFKPYCCCRWAHAPVRGAREVVRRFGINPERIEAIRVETFREACALTRKIPETSEEAQYSVAYPLAAAIISQDCGPDQVLEHGFQDHRIRSLMARIDFKVRDDFQALFPGRRFAEVFVRCGGKWVSSGPVSAPGDPDDPLSDSEMDEKFLRYSQGCEPLLKSALDLEDLSELKCFIEALCP